MEVGKMVGDALLFRIVYPSFSDWTSITISWHAYQI